MDYREFMIQELEKLNKKAKDLKEQADMVQYDTWRLQATFAKLEPDPEKDRRAEEIVKMQHSKTQQLEFTPETIQNIKSFSQSVNTLKELLHQKVYLDLIRNDIDRVISRLEILEEGEEIEVLKQCVWCKSIYNIHTGKWAQGPAEVLSDAQDTICPECTEKFKAISERRQINEK